MCLHAMRHYFFKWVAQISLVYNARWWFQAFLLTPGEDSHVDLYVSSGVAQPAPLLMHESS